MGLEGASGGRAASGSRPARPATSIAVRSGATRRRRTSSTARSSSSTSRRTAPSRQPDAIVRQPARRRRPLRGRRRRGPRRRHQLPAGADAEREDGDVRREHDAARPVTDEEGEKKGQVGRSGVVGRLLQPRRQVAVRRTSRSPASPTRSPVPGRRVGCRAGGSSSPRRARSSSVRSRSTRRRSSRARRRTFEGEIATAPLAGGVDPGDRRSGAARPERSPTSRPTRPSSSSPAGRRSTTTANRTRSAPATSASCPPGPRRTGPSTRP